MTQFSLLPSLIYIISCYIYQDLRNVTSLYMLAEQQLSFDICRSEKFGTSVVSVGKVAIFVHVAVAFCEGLQEHLLTKSTSINCIAIISLWKNLIERHFGIDHVWRVMRQDMHGTILVIANWIGNKVLLL